MNESVVEVVGRWQEEEGAEDNVTASNGMRDLPAGGKELTVEMTMKMGNKGIRM